MMESPFYILVVDDNRDLAVNLREILTETGYVAEAALDGAQAMEASRGRAFDLVLLDYSLPDTDGLTLQSRLSEIIDADYIVITGYASIESAAEAVGRKRIIAYETKPLKLDRLLAFIRQIRERRTAERERERAVSRLEAVFEAIPGQIDVIDRDFNLVETKIDPDLLERLGYSDKKEIIGRKCHEVFKGRPSICPECILARSMESGKTETRIFTAKEEERVGFPAKLYAAPVRDRNGTIVGGVECVMDIGDLRRMEAEIKASLRDKEVLLREIHHRVKNNLMVITSLVQMQADRTADPEALSLFDDLYHRVMAMSMVHDDLYHAGRVSRIDFAAYLERLTANIRRSFGRSPADVEVLAVNVWLDLEKAVPCGLIVSELVTNAFKHAFPQGGDPDAAFRESRPRIRVEMRREAGIHTVIVEDNGVGLPENHNWRESKGLGMNLVESWAEHQLGGKIDAVSRNGTRFTFTFAERR